MSTAQEITSVIHDHETQAIRIRTVEGLATQVEGEAAAAAAAKEAAKRILAWSLAHASLPLAARI